MIEGLENILKLGEAQQRADEEDYVAEKQRIIAVFENRIRDVIDAAFQPIHGTLEGLVPTAVHESFLAAYGT